LDEASAVGASTERGFSNALGAGLGGVFAERIERLALISLTDIASVYCFKPEEPTSTNAQLEPAKEREPDEELTDAARRYLLALALLAENHPRCTGSYRLRSGCELLAGNRELAVLGVGNHSEHVNALKEFCSNRELLIAVAKVACETLKIPATLPLFRSDAKGLKDYLEEGGKPKPAPKPKPGKK